jgi:prevent-host-death family protein
MHRATITEVKNGLSALIDRVRSGESILVTDRGIPVAVIEPVSELSDAELRLAALERSGLVRRGRAPFPEALLATPGPRLASGVSLVSDLLEERASGW